MPMFRNINTSLATQLPNVTANKYYYVITDQYNIGGSWPLTFAR